VNGVHGSFIFMSEQSSRENFVEQNLHLTASVVSFFTGGGGGGDDFLLDPKTVERFRRFSSKTSLPQRTSQLRKIKHTYRAGSLNRKAMDTTLYPVLNHSTTQCSLRMALQIVPT
jgi:hypothetical protein